MKMALKLAEKAKEKTYPNPMVGAVIVKGNKVIGKGYHAKAGEAHAEIRALSECGGSCSGAIMFVTLEPCDHYGRTAPCTQAIIESGIKYVYVAMKDPNTANNGKGIKKLKKAGINVEVGMCEEEARMLNRKYIKYITTGLPYVTLKLAQSIDGKIAARDGSSKWISSDESRALARKMRGSYDALMVGANTVLRDDPFLLGEKGEEYSTVRVIVDTRLKTPLNSNIFKTSDRSPVIVGTTELASESCAEKIRKIEGVEVVVVKSRNERVNLTAFLRALARKNIINILVEGGGEMAGSLVDEKLVDEVMFFLAPKILGGDHASIKGKGVRNISEAIELKDVEIQKVNKDILVKGTVCSQG